MLGHELNRDCGVLLLMPGGPLEAEDFQRMAIEVDAFLEKAGLLRGVLIAAEQFPGWSDFSAIQQHFRFVRDHHQRICRVAIASDSKMLTILPEIAAHFVAAEVRHFPFAEQPAALAWLCEDSAG